LLENPEPILEEIFCFILGQESLEGTNIKRRIEQTLKKGHDVSVAYKPKSLTANNNDYRFTKELKNEISDILTEFLYYFGYINHPDQANSHPYFDY